MDRIYVAIDLKSFYASVECVDRKLDPLTAHLVVADASRTDKTICLAVTPALKAHGIPGRARLFEVNQQVRRINESRRARAPGKAFSGSSTDAVALAADPALRLDFIIAPPRMSRYVEISTRIFSVYTQFVSPDDIHVYSIDEVFMDVTPYLKTYGCTAHELTCRMIRAVLRETGITATAGIGTNLYLAKVAMDIVAKHCPADRDGVRIAELDEMSYRKTLWSHRPLTDFWRVGKGYSRKLAQYGMFTMGDIARCSLGGWYSPWGEEKLYKLFGVNAELLIDHAWGYESCTIADIKAFTPENHSLSSGQVLPTPYPWDKARLVTREMADALALDLLDQRLVTDQVALMVSYDRESLLDPARRKAYQGPVEADYYGRMAPKAVHGSVSLPRFTASASRIMAAMTRLYDAIVDPCLLVRRITVAAGRVISEEDAQEIGPEQLNMFVDAPEDQRRRALESAALDRERRRQQAVLDIRRRFGKNAILRGMNFEEGATARARNQQIGGHKA